MSRYDRAYDYGLRGRPPVPRPAFRARRGPGDEPPHDRRIAYRNQSRVTQPYNIDYVYGARGERYDRNYNMYTGDRPDRMGDARMYRQPYMTTGGTRTFRGADLPTGYDRPDYGPTYGGRYPDEL